MASGGQVSRADGKKWVPAARKSLPPRPTSARSNHGTARAVARLALLAALATGAAACDDEPGFTGPGLGDFVQAVRPDDGEVVTAEELDRGAVLVLLNFIPAEGRFGFGALRGFRFDGDDVTELVQVTTQGGPPPTSASLLFDPDEAGEGDHDVEVEYLDSRGIVHRIRWSFTVRG